ncbi:unnamed protein product, partial [Allacma fusca]
NEKTISVSWSYQGP